MPRRISPWSLRTTSGSPVWGRARGGGAGPEQGHDWRGDADFEAVVEEMVAEFSRDEAADLAQAPKTPALLNDAVSEEADELEGELAEATNPRGKTVMAEPIDEPLDLGDNLFPDLAYERNPRPKGSSSRPASMSSATPRSPVRRPATS